MTEIMNHNDNILLQKFIRSFYRGSSNVLLQPDDLRLMTWDWQHKFLDATVKSSLLKKHPINRQFMRLFLKKTIEQLEGKQEVHDDFYSYLCLAMNNDGGEDSFSHKHYLINNLKDVITIKETNKMVVNGTTGMRTWEVALMLADWALCHKEIFSNRNIFELGSGVGFTGITIGKYCQPRCIYLSDCHPDVMTAICDNFRINFPLSKVFKSKNTTLCNIEERTTVGAMLLDWNSLEDLPDSIVPDVVIGADIVYDPAIIQPLCEVLKEFFNRNNHADVYIASVIRNEETFQAFLKNLDDMNFKYQKLSFNKSVIIEWDHEIKKCLLKINS